MSDSAPIRIGRHAYAGVLHAAKTTGTIQICHVGVYSGDGKRGLVPGKLHVTPATQRLINRISTPFTSADYSRLSHVYWSQVDRSKRIAQKLLSQNRFMAAIRFIEYAETAASHCNAIMEGRMRLYRLNPDVVQRLEWNGR